MSLWFRVELGALRAALVADVYSVNGGFRAAEFELAYAM